MPMWPRVGAVECSDSFFFIHPSLCLRTGVYVLKHIFVTYFLFVSGTVIMRGKTGAIEKSVGLEGVNL